MILGTATPLITPRKPYSNGTGAGFGAVAVVHYISQTTDIAFAYLRHLTELVSTSAICDPAGASSVVPSPLVGNDRRASSRPRDSRQEHSFFRILLTCLTSSRASQNCTRAQYRAISGASKVIVTHFVFCQSARHFPSPAGGTFR